jgi:hypothetical protein
VISSVAQDDLILTVPWRVTQTAAGTAGVAAHVVETPREIEALPYCRRILRGASLGTRTHGPVKGRGRLLEQFEQFPTRRSAKKKGVRLSGHDEKIGEICSKL